MDANREADRSHCFPSGGGLTAMRVSLPLSLSQVREDEVLHRLEALTSQPRDCFVVDQLVYAQLYGAAF